MRWEGVCSLLGPGPQIYTWGRLLFPGRGTLRDPRRVTQCHSYSCRQFLIGLYFFFSQKVPGWKWTNTRPGAVRCRVPVYLLCTRPWVWSSALEKKIFLVELVQKYIPLTTHSACFKWSGTVLPRSWHSRWELHPKGDRHLEQESESRWLQGLQNWAWLLSCCAAGQTWHESALSIHTQGCNASTAGWGSGLGRLSLTTCFQDLSGAGLRLYWAEPGPSPTASVS